MQTSPVQASHFAIREAHWPEDEELLRSIRNRVFIQEQGVPAELEWDGRDESCVHVLAHEPHGEAVGTARMTRDGHIGRMAVLPAWRFKGAGSALLDALLQHARSRGLSQVYLNAQTYAVGFYQRFGFRPEGPVFREAGIPHRRMTLQLSNHPPHRGARFDPGDGAAT